LGGSTIWESAEIMGFTVVVLAGWIYSSRRPPGRLS